MLVALLTFDTKWRISEIHDVYKRKFLWELRVHSSFDRYASVTSFGSPSVVSFDVACARMCERGLHEARLVT